MSLPRDNRNNTKAVLFLPVANRDDLVKKLLTFVLQGNQSEVKKILDAQPKNEPNLLFEDSYGKDYSGRTIIASPFRAAVGAKDEAMLKLMREYIIDPQDKIEARRQFCEQYPELEAEIYPDTTPEEKDKPADERTYSDEEADDSIFYDDSVKQAYHFEALVKAISEDPCIEGKPSHKTEAALEKFRADFTPTYPIEEGEHFNFQTLIEAYNLLERNSSPYALGSIFDSDPGPRQRIPNKLYLNAVPKGLNYEVLGPDNKLKQGCIPWSAFKGEVWGIMGPDELERELKSINATIINSKDKFLPILLRATTENGHTDRQYWNEAQGALFWRQVIGYIQRFLPANYAQALCMGIGKLTELNEELSRDLNIALNITLEKEWDGQETKQETIPLFPLKPNSGLGYDFAAYTHGEVITQRHEGEREGESAKGWLALERKKRKSFNQFKEWLKAPAQAQTPQPGR